MKTFEHHFDILPEPQKKIWNSLSPCKDLGNGLSLEKGLACSAALFGKQFPPSESVKVLTYFQGGNLDLLTNIEKGILISAAKNILIYQLPKVEILSYCLGIQFPVDS